MTRLNQSWASTHDASRQNHRLDDAAPVSLGQAKSASLRSGGKGGGNDGSDFSPADNTRRFFRIASL